MKNILNIISRHQTVSAIIIFIVINALFNIQAIKEIVLPASEDRVAVGDSTLAEFITENNYQNILRGENPFIIHQKLFYPFDINLSLNDPGSTNAIFFFILRPFFTIHKSVLIVVLVNSFLSNLLMYLLLKKLKIATPIALMLGLSYGFMPVAAYRLLGHYTYTSIYFFPLLHIVFLRYLEKNNFSGKLIYALLLGVLMPLLLLHNFYFFLIVIMSIIMYSVFYLLTKPYSTFEFYIKNFLYFAISIIPFILILFPWFQAVRYFFLTDEVAPMPGYGGAVELSADLLGLITPSEFNPFYRFLIFHLADFFTIFEKFKNFYLFNWEKFVYPGLFIILTYLYILFRHKHIPQKVKSSIAPHFYVSLVFGILLLGPFLKVANRFALVLDEGIHVFFPLPFLILHYLPGLGTLRAPTRFSPAFIFLAIIVVAYIWQWLYSNFSFKKRVLSFILIVFIFFLDQYYILPPRTSFDFPIKLYNYIKMDPQKATVMEIPFTVRDGFEYLGFVHGISPMNGHFYHNKPIIGGYFARVPIAIFSYYKRLPFTGYIAKIIDKGNYEPTKEDPKDVVITPFIGDMKQVENEINFLAIKYVLIKNDEKYSEQVKSILTKIGFKKSMSDGEYDLYERPLSKKVYNRHTFGGDEDLFYLPQGFGEAGKNYRTISGKRARVFLKVPDNSFATLEYSFESTSGKNNVDIYINNSYVVSQVLSEGVKTYHVPKIPFVHEGINTITFIFSRNKGAISASESRPLKFYSIGLIR